MAEDHFSYLSKFAELLFSQMPLLTPIHRSKTLQELSPKEQSLEPIKSKINLSKTLLTPQVLTPQFSAFVAKFVYSIWHTISFQSAATQHHKGLPHFVRFTHEILRSTSLPFSVVLLALKLIHTLKTRRPALTGAPGSECRLIVCALMLAMKSLCDNTYSNRSWEKISGIPLIELNQTEMEFLVQIQFDLVIPASEYFEWLETIEQAVISYRQMQSPPSPVSPYTGYQNGFPPAYTGKVSQKSVAGPRQVYLARDETDRVLNSTVI